MVSDQNRVTGAAGSRTGTSPSEFRQAILDHLHFTQARPVDLATRTDWYLALATANIGAEYNYLVPEDSYQCFLARAWILGESPEKTFQEGPLHKKPKVRFIPVSLTASAWQ